MAKMTFTAATAKSLCTDEEYRLFQKAQPAQLEKLTLVRLKDLVTLSRNVRDKWRDVSRTQKRSSQTSKGHRQTADNARSKDKALLLQEIHDTFVDRLKRVENNEVQVATGKRPTTVDREDRKIVHRAVRSLTREALADKKRGVNKKAKQSEAAKATSEGDAATAKGSSTKETSAKKGGAKKAVAQKKGGASAAAKKKPVVTPARKRALAKKAAAPKLTPPTDDMVNSPKSSPDLPPSKIAAKNRPLKAKASQNRINTGGGTRIRGHVQASGARRQARRDSK